MKKMMRRGVRVAICAEHVRSNAVETLCMPRPWRSAAAQKKDLESLQRRRRTLLRGTDKLSLPFASGRRQQPKRVQAD